MEGTTVADIDKAALAQLVELHVEWAYGVAADIVDGNGGVFEEEVFKRTLLMRRRITSVIDSFGISAHTALHNLLIDCGIAHASRTAKA